MGSETPEKCSNNTPFFNSVSHNAWHDIQNTLLF